MLYQSVIWPNVLSPENERKWLVGEKASRVKKAPCWDDFLNDQRTIVSNIFYSMVAKKNKLERFTLKSVLAGLMFESEAFPSGANYFTSLYG